MTAEEAIRVLRNERECVQRQGCDRNCAVCDLVLPDEIIINAYDMAIAAFRQNDEEVKAYRAEIEEIRCNLSKTRDEREKLGIKYEQALMQIDDLKGKVEFLKGQIEAYQYCMNCRR